eukprot:scaffold6067_cov112-Isochrysis_galbana.AAC.1
MARERHTPEVKRYTPGPAGRRAQGERRGGRARQAGSRRCGGPVGRGRGQVVDDVEGDCEDDEHQGVEGRPLAERVDRPQHSLPPAGREVGAGEPPGEQHQSQLQIGPDAGKEGDKHAEYVGLGAPHVADGVDQREGLDRRQLDGLTGERQGDDHFCARKRVAEHKNNHVAPDEERHAHLRQAAAETSGEGVVLHVPRPRRAAAGCRKRLRAAGRRQVPGTVAGETGRDVAVEQAGAQAGAQVAEPAAPADAGAATEAEQDDQDERGARDQTNAHRPEIVGGTTSVRAADERSQPAVGQVQHRLAELRVDGIGGQSGGWPWVCAVVERLKREGEATAGEGAEGRVACEADGAQAAEQAVSPRVTQLGHGDGAHRATVDEQPSTELGHCAPQRPAEPQRVLWPVAEPEARGQLEQKRCVGAEAEVVAEDPAVCRVRTQRVQAEEGVEPRQPHVLKPHPYGAQHLVHPPELEQPWQPKLARLGAGRETVDQPVEPGRAKGVDGLVCAGHRARAEAPPTKVDQSGARRHPGGARSAPHGLEGRGDQLVDGPYEDGLEAAAEGQAERRVAQCGRRQPAVHLDRLDHQCGTERREARAEPLTDSACATSTAERPVPLIISRAAAPTLMLRSEARNVKRRASQPAAGPTEPKVDACASPHLTPPAASARATRGGRPVLPPAHPPPSALRSASLCPGVGPRLGSAAARNAHSAGLSAAEPASPPAGLVTRSSTRASTDSKPSDTPASSPAPSAALGLSSSISEMESRPPTVTLGSDTCSMPSGPSGTSCGGRLRLRRPVLCVRTSIRSSTPAGTTVSSRLRSIGGAGGRGGGRGGTGKHAAVLVAFGSSCCRRPSAASRNGPATSKLSVRGRTASPSERRAKSATSSMTASSSSSSASSRMGRTSTTAIRVLSLWGGQGTWA